MGHRVLMSHNRKVAIELRRSKTHVTAVLSMRGHLRTVKRFKADTFDKSWGAMEVDGGLPYPVYEAAMAWLDNATTGLIPLTPTAKKELQMIVIIHKNKIFGKFADMATADSVAPVGSAVLDVDGVEALLALKGVALAELHNTLFPEEVIAKVTKKEAVAMKIWNEIVTAKVEVTAAPVSHTDGPVARIKALIMENKDKSRKEVLELCVAAGYNLATTKTQYAKLHHGEGKIMDETGAPKIGAVAQAKAIIAELFTKEFPKDVITAGVAKGVNKATMQTQYYIFKKANPTLTAPVRPKTDKDAEADAAKAAKEAEKAEAKAKKDAEKAEAKALKDAEKAEAKAKKDAEKLAAKEAKDAEKAEAQAAKDAEKAAATTETPASPAE